MIKLYNQKAKAVRINIDLKDTDSNVRYYSNYLIKHKNKLISRLINKMIRSIDAVEEEKMYVQEKFKFYIDIIDSETQENIKRLVKIILACKYYYRMNHQEERDCEIN